MSTGYISWGGKGGWCVRLTTLQPSCAECLEIWEPQPPGTLRACPGIALPFCVCVCVCVCVRARVCAVFTTVLWFSQLLCKCKGKVALFQAWSGPEGSMKLRFPDFVTMAQDGGKVVSLTHRPPLPPGNTPGTHFCYRLSRPQGHSAIGRILCQ